MFKVILKHLFALITLFVFLALVVVLGFSALFIGGWFAVVVLILALPILFIGHLLVTWIERVFKSTLDFFTERVNAMKGN